MRPKLLSGHLRRLVLCCVLASTPAWAVQRGSLYEPLDIPARTSHLATHANLFGITRAGDRLVAVGQRGFILYSDDKGKNWQQANVPVSTTLLSVNFPTPESGWAVGHDGVILHSEDGGENWVKQMDGYQAIELGLSYYQQKLTEEPDNETYALLLGEFEFAQEQGADRPFFFVWFENEMVGYAIGAYSIAFSTVDGGKNWLPIMELQANPYFHHLFDYDVTPNRRFLAGESGELWFQDEPAAPMKAVSPFYDGSLYTITHTCSSNLMLAAGLRGNAFFSSDNGETWDQLDVPTSASINGSICLEDDRLVLVTQAGEVLVSKDPDDPLTFDKVTLERPFPLSDVAEGDQGEVVVVGLGGVVTVPLN